MKKIILAMLAITLGCQAWGYTCQRTEYGVISSAEATDIEIQFFSPKIVRVFKYPTGKRPEKKSFSVIKDAEKVGFQIREFNNIITLTSSDVVVLLNRFTGDVTFTGTDSKPFITEKSRTTQFIDVTYGNQETYKVLQTFMLEKEEAVYGLGQQQTGKMNQRNQTLQLRQENMHICIPFIQSVKGYGLFWDNYSPTRFDDSINGMTFESSVGECVDYYFMYGGNADGVIAQMRELTGQVPMYPLWTYGFWQSRERYTSQDEIVGVVKKYRELGIPLDGIVQDWQYWGTDNTHWNAVEFGNPAFPDPKKMIDDIHALNAHAIISVWPSFGPNTDIYKELDKGKMLFTFETFPQGNGVKVYDPFNPKAREIYWNFMNKNIFSQGMDGWWLDATEPEYSGTEQELDQPAFCGSLRSIYNAFPLVSVGGVYDLQRKTTSAKRVYILTRSAFAGQQRYAANSWSGDIVSRWDVLRKQIPAGLNFSLCAIPYWNTDIGGFFADRVYPDGIKDIAYHELYVRWMQFATFTPMMRSHGTSTPREIFMFGNRGDWAFDVQEKYINLRYSLIPYMYSVGYDITENAGSMMRALSMDFVNDTRVHNIDNQYMFGKSFLVAPVTDSMYVHRNNGAAESDFGKTGSREVYLPEGTDWYDFWSGEKHQGGRSVIKQTPIDIIPIYVKAGSILPWGHKVQFAEEKNLDNLNIFIFPGADGEFVLYEDEGDNYNYEEGHFSVIKMKWNDKNRTLTIGLREGEYPGMLENRTFRVSIVCDGKTISTLNEPDAEITYNGQNLSVKL